MRIRSFIVFLIFIHLSIFLLAINSDDARASNSSQSSIPPETTEPPVIVDKALLYADYHNVTIEEAERRLVLQEEMRGIYREIQNHETFAGLWLEHTPTFKIVVQFTENGQEILQEYPMSDELSDVVETRTVTASLHSLKEIQATTWEMVKDSGIKIDHAINIKTNHVELYLSEPPNLLIFLANHNKTLSSKIKLIQTQALSQETANLFGGLQLFASGSTTSWCSSGYSVMHEIGGDIGVTTAGHCPEDMDYLGIQIPFQAQQHDSTHDIQWHTPASHTIKPFIFNGTSNLLTIDTRPYSSQMIGETVCKHGASTGFGCGDIVSKTFLGTYILITHPTIDVSEPGDSGGSWFVGNTAYGTMVGHVESPSLSGYYMAIDFIDVLDLCVLRSPASPSIPNLTGILSSGQVQLSWTNPDDICGHAIYRSTSPYFTPNSSNLVGRFKKSVVGFNSSVGVGNTNSNYTYLIRPVIGFNETTSKRIGEFDFAIVPGT